MDRVFFGRLGMILFMHSKTLNTIKKLEFVQKMIDEWIDQEIIVPGNSPWAFPVVVVPKPNSTDLRLCVDLRRLNAVIVKDSFDAPRNDDALAWLGGKKYRSTLDIRWGYHNMALTEAAQQILTFACPLDTTN